MRGLAPLIWTQAKLYLREPVATFFTIFYAPLMLILFGSIYGNEPNPMFGRRGTVDISVPAYMALVGASVGLIGLPIAIATEREKGILRRYRATPLHPLAYLVSDVVTYLAMTLLGVLLLVLVGRVGWNLRFEGNALSMLGGFVLGMLSIFAFGFLVGCLSPTARIAQTVGMVLAFPMMFVSGATIPWEILPDGVRRVAEFVPLTHVVRVLRKLWAGGSWEEVWVSAVVPAGVLIVSSALSARFFRWE
ncbi:MAG: ABC transporter permease [Chloroflexia bacterium]